MASETLTFNLLARDQASNAFRKIARSSDDVHKRFGFLAARTKNLTAGMRVSFGQVTTALGGIAAVKVFKSFIDEAREAGRVSRITSQVIKSTGGAANVTAGHVAKLSENLSNQVGIDDELIQTGSNLLLTFKNVRNEVGKGNAIFDRATAAAVDLSAAGFGSVQSASKMLGKALNDPLKGLTALGRAGVTFTKGQKKQIEALVEAGDVLSAQRIILKEVESQVGGAAKAAADPIARLGVVVNNLKERLGTALLPVVTILASVITNKVVPAIEGLADPLERNVTPVMARFVNILQKDAVPAFQTLSKWITGSLIPSLKNLWETFGPLVISTAEFALQVGRLAIELGTNLLGAIKPVTKWMAEHKTLVQSTVVVLVTAIAAWKAYQLAITVVAKVTKAYIAVQAALNVVLTANPIGLIVIALAALAAGLVYAYKNSETFRKIVDGAFRAVRDIAVATFNWIKKNWPLLLAILTGPIGLAAAAIIKNFNKIKDVFRVVFLFVANLFFDVVRGIIGGVARLVGVFAKLPGPLGKPFKKARDAIKGAEDAVRDLQNRINRTHGKTVTVSVRMQMKNRLKIAAQQGVALTISGKPIALAAGGPVRGPGGPTGDKIPAQLSDGEYVIKAASARRLGTQFLDTLNRASSIGGDPAGMTLGFATGGLVSRAQAFVRAQASDPYIWGGVGPNGFDCSGLTGAVYGLLTGRSPYRRYFTTASNFAALGFKPGTGAYTIGVNPYTHMAGNIGGLPFEAANTRSGIHVGNGAQSVLNFAKKYYLAALGGIFGGNASVALGSSDLRKLMKAISINWGVRTGGSPVTFDRGGWLHPGATLAMNNTGRPERVLPPGVEGGITINGGLHLHGVQDVNGLVAELQRYAKRNGGIKIRTFA